MRTSHDDVGSAPMAVTTAWPGSLSATCAHARGHADGSPLYWFAKKARSHQNVRPQLCCPTPTNWDAMNPEVVSRSAATSG